MIDCVVVSVQKYKRKTMVNDIVLTIDFPEWIRQKSANDMFDLMQAFNIDLPAENEIT